MIHEVIDRDEFLKNVSETLGKSGKSNRFVTIGATTRKKTKEWGEVWKVTIAQFEIGSSYVDRMRKEHREGKDFKPKRDSYYDDYNENGTVKSLKSDPSKKYIAVWKSALRYLYEVYTDDNGNILEDVTPIGDELDRPRYYKLDNVWYVSGNKQKLITEDYHQFKDFLDNI